MIPYCGCRLEGPILVGRFVTMNSPTDLKIVILKKTIRMLPYKNFILSKIWALFPLHVFPDLHNPAILLLKCGSVSVNILLRTH